MRTTLLIVTSLFALAACGGAAQPAPSATAQPAQAATATPTPSPAATAAPAAAGALTFTVQAGSKAVVRVNEQLADRTLPNDAVLTSEKVTGAFTLNPDGTFAASSKIAVDLNALASDNSRRDGFIKDNTLQTRRFPEAVFVPVRATGLTLPLAASGEMTFKLTGQMTIRGVTKELTFDVKAARSGGDLTATATVAPAFQFATFGMDQPRVFSVISIKDEIRLEVQLLAKQ